MATPKRCFRRIRRKPTDRAPAGDDIPGAAADRAVAATVTADSAVIGLRSLRRGRTGCIILIARTKLSSRNTGMSAQIAMTPAELHAIALEKRYCAHNYDPLPVVLARGEGACVWDITGRRYVDMMSAYSAVSHGHAHPRILAAPRHRPACSPCRRGPFITIVSGLFWPSCAG